MKLCNKDCTPVCDFCAFYNFNGDKDGIYTGRGWCKLLHKRKEPESFCKRFHCYMTLSLLELEKYFRRFFKKRHDCERRVAEVLKRASSRGQS